MPIYEVAIAARTFDGPGRAQEGDIILAREPLGEIGKFEQEDYIWLLLESDLSTDELMAPGATGKRRYSINLATLQGGAVNLARARNPRDTYQPFFTVNPIDGRATPTQPAARSVPLVDRGGRPVGP